MTELSEFVSGILSRETPVNHGFGLSPVACLMARQRCAFGSKVGDLPPEEAPLSYWLRAI